MLQLDLLNDSLNINELKPFRPRQLRDLINFLYEEEVLREHMLKQVIEDQNSAGWFWEQVLAKAMSHTELCEHRNQVGKDFKDGTDGKFAMAGRYSNSSQRQATIGIENKIGDLRVCLCYRGADYHKLYFMRIPYSAYSKVKGQNIKVTFANFIPSGKWWDQYQCSWEEVIAP